MKIGYNNLYTDYSQQQIKPEINYPFLNMLIEIIYS
jgi:hypothetical protein